MYRCFKIVLFWPSISCLYVSYVLKPFFPLRQRNKHVFSALLTFVNFNKYLDTKHFSIFVEARQLFLFFFFVFEALLHMFTYEL